MPMFAKIAGYFIASVIPVLACINFKNYLTERPLLFVFDFHCRRLKKQQSLSPADKELVFQFLGQLDTMPKKNVYLNFYAKYKYKSLTRQFASLIKEN
jgi:hypothetical protein